MKNELYKLFDKIAEWSLCVLIFTLPFAKSIIEITIVISMVSLVIRKMVSREKILTDFSSVEILLLIYLVASLPSFVNTQYMSLSIRAFFTKMLKFAALFIIVKEVINTREKLVKVVTIAAISCGIILIDGFIQYFITHRDLLHNYPSFLYVESTPLFLGNPTASFPFPNDYAAWILIFIFPVMIFTISGSMSLRIRLINASLFAGLSYTLLLVRVRGAWVAFIISFLFASIFKMKNTLMALFMIVLLTVVIVDRSVVVHMLKMASAKDRGAMFSGGLKIFKEHPIVGNGINSFFQNYAKVREDSDKNKRGSYAHNCYLQMAAEVGIVGLASFLAFVIALIFKGLKTARRSKDPLCAVLAFGLVLGISSFLIHSAADTNLYSLNLAALFWFSAGLLMAVCRLDEQGV